MGNEDDKTGIFDQRSTVKAQVENMSPAGKADLVDMPPAQTPLVDESSNYAVAAGDTLATIAKRFYGDANAWQRIFDANRDQLTDPDRVRHGQMLKIPGKI